MSEQLNDIYRDLESRYVHEGRTIDQSFYRDLSDDFVAKFTNIGFDCLLSLDDQICPRCHPLRQKKPKKPPPKRTRNIGKSKRTQLTTSSSTDSPPSDNEDLPSTKLSPRSYSRALSPDPNMSKEQKETRGKFKNLGRALHEFAKMLKKGCGSFGSTDPLYGRSGGSVDHQLLLWIHKNQGTDPADGGSVDPLNQLAGTASELQSVAYK
ncbi:hypothetical protein Tco_0858562 [Tanacetum coccineum]|uniref:Uncharacterized protein n=1 Tax=Tanacetum coccineum TaxID=301880 RepID=A0ABQ5B9H5_9ASTR